MISTDHHSDQQHRNHQKKIKNKKLKKKLSYVFLYIYLHFQEKELRTFNIVKNPHRLSVKDEL